jgi:NAD(P)-dependent dehydrogenase (short-subunit alcohol dehydrogenase family)
VSPSAPAAERAFDLSGRVVYVPGGYGGIGAALCRSFARQGAAVAVAGRSVDKAEKLAERLREGGNEAMALAVDVTSVEEIRASVDRVVAELGAIDVLCNSVGIQREQGILDVTEEAFDEVYAVNLKAAMFLGQAVAAHQVESGIQGSHIHLLSVRSKLGIRGRGYSAYASTKGGMALLVKQHAMELAPHRITVNGIAPTFTYTDMITELMADEQFRDEVIARIPLGRIASPEDIGGAAVFMASPAARYITGQILYLDGGITASQ